MPLLAEPISHVFNLSIQTGYIPNEFKTARVIPIYKSDSEFSFNNYRPISLLPALSKLLEKIVEKRNLVLATNSNFLIPISWESMVETLDISNLDYLM